MFDVMDRLFENQQFKSKSRYPSQQAIAHKSRGVGLCQDTR